MPGPDPGGPEIGWKTKAKIAVAVLAIVGFALLFTGVLPGFTAPEPPTEGSFWGVAIPLGLGVLTFYFGWREFRKVQLVRNTPTSKVRSLAVGAAEVEGQARPVEEPLTSPLTGKDAVFYELEFKEQKGKGSDSSSRIVYEFRDHVPFQIDDGTGAVRVAPEGADLQIDQEEKVTIPPDEDPPEKLATWAEEEAYLEGERYDPGAGPAESSFFRIAREPREELSSELSSSSGKRRWVEERVLEADETAFVWGAAHRRDGARSTDNERNLELREHEGTGVFILGDGSQADVFEYKLDGVIVMLAASTMFLLYAFLVFFQT